MVKNQYRRKKVRRRKFPLKLMLSGGLFFCLFGALAYFLVWSPYFRVSRIEFAPDKTPRYYNQDDIREIVRGVLDGKKLGFIPRKSIFLASTGDIISAVSERYPEIKSVRLNKEFPDAVLLAIEERTGVGVWCQAERKAIEPPAGGEEKTSTSSGSVPSVLSERKIGRCFSIDREGIIYRESALVEGGFVTNIFSAKIVGPEIRDRVASERTMDFILRLKDGLPKVKTTGGLSLSPAEFEIVSEEDLRTATDAGFEIYFNPGYPLETQLGALEMVLESEIRENAAALEYVDLRIKGRAYYK